MTSLETIDNALAQLNESGAWRDTVSGLWRQADGQALAVDPIESAQRLRQRKLHKAMSERRHWTR